MTVRGSKQYRSIVVHYHPWRRYALILGWVISLLIAVVFSYHFGLINGAESFLAVQEERDSLQLRVQKKVEELDVLRQRFAASEMGAKIDRRAAEEVRLTVKDLEQELGQLREEISFYKGLMAPADKQEGFSLRSFDITSSGEEGRFHYKLVFQQMAKKHRLLKGDAHVKIVGLQTSIADDGSETRNETSLPLHSISDQLSEESIKLRFKYFQTIEGDLTLPDGFVPQSVELAASVGNNAAGKIEKKFGWLIQES